MTVAARDQGIAAALFAGTLGYLWFWPRELNGFDESLYLYQAKRVFEGAVMYRDLFDLITPLWFYLVAGAYAVLGVGIETARWLMAVNHGLIAVLTFLLCRTAGVRAVVAVPLAMTHLVLAYPGCPIATPHWFSTLLILLLLLTQIRWAAPTLIRAGLLGVLAGALTLVQQQKGVIIGLGAALAMIVDAACATPRESSRVIVQRLSAYTAGVLVMTGVGLLPFIILAGFDEVFRATVRVPLINYPAMVGGNVPWGGYWPGIVPHGYIIKYLPLIIPVAALRLAWGWWSGIPRPLLRLPLMSFVYAAFALWAVWYLPDHLHFSYVATVWFVLASAMAAPLLRGVAIGRLVSILAVVGIASGVWQLSDTLQSWQRRCQFQFDSPFGRIDTQNPEAGAVYAWFNELFRRAGATHIFAFPTNPALYLITGTDNPTRYQILQPRYTDRDQLTEVVTDLERNQTLFIVRNFYFAPKEMGVLNTYIDLHYEKLPLPPPFKTTNIIGVYQRKAPANAARAPMFQASNSG